MTRQGCAPALKSQIFFAIQTLCQCYHRVVHGAFCCQVRIQLLRILRYDPLALSWIEAVA